MTKKEENVENLSTSFKIKLTKKDLPSLWDGKYGIKPNKGLYQQLKSTLYPPQNQLQTRKVKIITNQAGAKLFEEALVKEIQKQLKKDEYRKKFNLRSEIFKQTYKFR